MPRPGRCPEHSHKHHCTIPVPSVSSLWLLLLQTADLAAQKLQGDTEVPLDTLSTFSRLPTFPPHSLLLALSIPVSTRQLVLLEHEPSSPRPDETRCRVQLKVSGMLIAQASSVPGDITDC